MEAVVVEEDSSSFSAMDAVVLFVLGKRKVGCSGCLEVDISGVYWRPPCTCVLWALVDDEFLGGLVVTSTTHCRVKKKCDDEAEKSRKSEN